MDVADADSQNNSPVQFRTPLRAHAPIFVPTALQGLQGKKAELH